MNTPEHLPALVIVGASQIIGDVLEVALLTNRPVRAILLDEPESSHSRDRPLAERLEAFSSLGIRPEVLPMQQWRHDHRHEYILGPTSPRRRDLRDRFVQQVPEAGPLFARLVHPTAVVSRTAVLGPGCFVGALSTIASGASLASHVFINRQAAVGHDSVIGDYSRLQPGSRVAGLVEVGQGVTLGLGAQVLERVRIGDRSDIAATALVRRDVPADTRFLGRPERVHP